MYVSNGHGPWEAALANTVAEGDTVLVCATGHFALGWAGVARGQGIEVETLDFGRAAPIDPNRVEARLRADTGRKIKAVLVTHVDTSTSILNNIKQVRGAIDAAGHPALLMADCIASMGCDRYEMQGWGVDVACTASQKGFMVPPGMGFVFFSDKADAARGAMARVPVYWDWRPRANPERYYQYFMGTAPTHHLYGLRAALDLIHAEGIEAVWARHDRLARAIWAAVAVWRQGGAMRLNVPDPEYRSRAVTSLTLDPPDGTRLRDWLEREAGVTLGIGLGMQTEDDPDGDGAFRIGHMGHVNAHMIMGVLGTMEAGLTALNIAHGRGAVAAAVLAEAG